MIHTKVIVMKISKSKRQLAQMLIKAGVEKFPEGANWAARDGNKDVDFFTGKSYKDMSWWQGDYDAENRISMSVKIPNLHQTVLSRDEFDQIVAETVVRCEPDADGWIEHKGDGCPVGGDVAVCVKFRNGAHNITGISASNFYWKHDNCISDIIAYRLHKPEQANSEFCESVTRAIPDPDEQVWTNPPSIEQLAADYRNAKDYAERKQQEADAAKADAEAKLKALELACEALGLLVSPITAKQEPELVITDRSQLELGDVIWLSDSTVKENNELTPSGEYTVVKVGVIGVESDGQTIYPDFSTREWRFIRRP